MKVYVDKVKQTLESRFVRFDKFGIQGVVKLTISTKYMLQSALFHICFKIGILANNLCAFDKLLLKSV